MRGSRLSIGLVFGLIAIAVLVAPACVNADSAAQPSGPPDEPIPVRDEASFKAALAQAKGGETIELADGIYPLLTVENRTYTKPVRITGSRSAKIAGMSFLSSSNLVLSGVTIAPVSVTAKLTIMGSSRDIVIDGVLIDGRDERLGAFVVAKEGTNVTIRGSELTNCGHHTGCIRPGVRNLRVLGNRFYDCRSCTYIKGGGNGALIQGNTFDRAHSGSCVGGQASCPHNDHIHIQGGGPWTIVGNRFGDYEVGAAQVYANPGLSNHANPIRDLLIASNVFAGEAGVAIRIGIGMKSGTPPPKNIRIVNNTVLSGRVAGVFLTEPWAVVPLRERPLVANNIVSSVQSASCGRGRFVKNLTLRGAACQGDSTGNPKLHPKTAAPTAKSSLVVDKADPRHAPKTDFYGRLRKGPPDLGAIELGGRQL